MKGSSRHLSHIYFIRSNADVAEAGIQVVIKTYHGNILRHTVSIPFLAYGLGNCLANSLMVGVILCVFRNSNVMMEELERKTGIQTADIKRRETKTES